MRTAWYNASRYLSSAYVTKCSELRRQLGELQTQHGALMHLSAGRASGVVMICLPSAPGSASHELAVSNIVRVDPSSQGVLFDKTQQISLDVGVSDITVHFSGVKQPFATCGQVAGAGLLVRTRQLTAPPQLRETTWPVGRWHRVSMSAAVKGCRAPQKMYTDLKLEMDDVVGNYSSGYEATWTQLAQASKRMVTPSSVAPDGAPVAAGGPSLPWWDMMRYMWRGVAKLTVRGLSATLSKAIAPEVRPCTPLAHPSTACMMQKMQPSVAWPGLACAACFHTNTMQTVNVATGTAPDNVMAAVSRF